MTNRLTIAKAIASKTYAFAGNYPEDAPQYDCGEWEEMGELAHATYLDAADAVIAEIERLNITNANHGRDQYREALETLIAKLDACNRFERGAGGMTIEAQIRRTELRGVPAIWVEEAREALASALSPSSQEGR
jgi:hypothetical protein